MINIFLKSRNILTKKDNRKLLTLAFSKLFLGLAEIISVLSFVPFLSLISNPNYIDENDTILLIKNKINFTNEMIVILLAAIPFIIIIFVNFFRLFLAWLESKVSNDLWYSVHSNLFNYYLQKNYMFHIKNGSNVLMEKLMARANMALTAVIIPSYQIIGNTLLTSVIVGTLIFYNPVMAMLTFLMIAVFYFSLYTFFKKKIDSYGKFSPEFSKRIFKLVEETFKSIKTVKLENNFDLFVEQFKKNTKRYTSNSTYLDFFMATPRTVTEVFGYSFALAATLLLLFYQKQSFSEVVVVLGIYLVALQKLIPVIQDFFLKFSGIRVNRFSLEIMEKDLKESTNLELKSDNKKDSKKIKNFSEITIKDLNFEYEGNENFKLNVEKFKINKNELVCISGKSGSGKSTFLNILTGLINDKKTNIFLDDKKITEKDIISYQSLIDYLPQNIFILNDTIYRNIAFGIKDEDIDHEKVKFSAKLACIHEHIETNMSESYNTIVGEDAVRLSGGQRQRIGIARALYSNKKIIILDEATSSLDKKNEQQIIDNIISLKDKTIILVTHNPEILKKFKRVLFFDEGKLSEKKN